MHMTARISNAAHVWAHRARELPSGVSPWPAQRLPPASLQLLPVVKGPGNQFKTATHHCAEWMKVAGYR